MTKDFIEKEPELQEDILLQFLKGIEHMAFITTHHEDGSVTEHQKTVNDMEAIIEINAQVDREELKKLLFGVFNYKRIEAQDIARKEERERIKKLLSGAEDFAERFEKVMRDLS